MFSCSVSLRRECPENVIFEIGVALGLAKPVVRIGAGCDAYRALPTDLQGWFVAVYSRPSKTRAKSKGSVVERTDTQAIRAAIVAIASKLPSRTRVARNP